MTPLVIILRKMTKFLLKIPAESPLFQYINFAIDAVFRRTACYRDMFRENSKNIIFWDFYGEIFKEKIVILGNFRFLFKICLIIFLRSFLTFFLRIFFIIFKNFFKNVFNNFSKNFLKIFL